MEIREGLARRLGVVKNTDIAEIGEDVLDELVEDVVGSMVDAVTTFCTVLVAAQRMHSWEKNYQVPVFAIWDILRECGDNAKELEGWE